MVLACCFVLAERRRQGRDARAGKGSPAPAESATRRRTEAAPPPLLPPPLLARGWRRAARPASSRLPCSRGTAGPPASPLLPAGGATHLEASRRLESANSRPKSSSGAPPPWRQRRRPSGDHWGGGHGWISAASGGLGPFASEPACCPSSSARAGGVRGPRARRPRPPVQSFCTALEMERRGPLSNLARVLQYPAVAKCTPNVYCSARLQSPVRAA